MAQNLGPEGTRGEIVCLASMIKSLRKQGAGTLGAGTIWAGRAGYPLHVASPLPITCVVPALAAHLAKNDNVYQVAATKPES